MSGMHAQPSGATFDLVLLAHVACVVVALATVSASTATAVRLRRRFGTGGALPEPIVRYFKPGVNWAGRFLYGIPVFGVALLAMSHGAYSFKDAWVMSGLAIFIIVALLAEGLLWPAERRVANMVHARAPDDDTGVAPEPNDAALVRDAKTMVWAGTLVLVLLVTGTVVMVAQP